MDKVLRSYTLRCCSIFLSVILLSGCGFLPFTQPTQPPAPTVVPVTVSPDQNLPAPRLSNTPWNDRSIYKDGLIREDQSILNGLAGASVYHIGMTIADTYEQITGSEEVLYTNVKQQPMDQIVFHLYPSLFGGKMDVLNIQVNGKPTQSTRKAQDSVLEILLDKPLEPGMQIVISMDYTIDLPADSSGNYNTFGYTDQILTLPQAYPLLSVYENGAWHEEIPPPYGDVGYSESSFYEVSVSAPIDFVMVTSGSQRNKQVKGSHQIVTFAAGPVREFYLAGSQNFAPVSYQAGETLVNSYSLIGETSGAESSLQTASRALEVFNDRIGLYPFTEFDIVATPTTALGVEYPGIIAINREMEISGSTSSDQMNRIYLESTVAHETGHQWFYSVVGDDQVNHPWLDESLSQYITWLYFVDTASKDNAEGFRQSWLSRWDRVGRDNMPIGYPVSKYNEQQYGAIIYGRGPLFFEELSHQIGEAKFADFLKDYYANNAFGIATPEILEQTAEKECSCNLNALFQKWVTP
jgi:hypothetical protein